jgi:hypothetical protein
MKENGLFLNDFSSPRKANKNNNSPYITPNMCLTLTQSEKVKKIIRSFLAAKGITIEALADAIGVERWKLSYSLNRRVSREVFYKMQDYVNSLKKDNGK